MPRSVSHSALLFASLIAGALAGAASADTCPAAPDHSEVLQSLISQVRVAPNEFQAAQISNEMWSYWADAPNEQAQAILDRGMRRRSSYDFIGALADFDALVDYCPHYAEGYNQRAFVNYLRHDFPAALVDLDRALEISPQHIAAMSGKALSLYALGRLDEASAVLQQALSLNPWLPERGLAGPGGPLEPKGQEL